MSSNMPFTLIIPAHNEETVIARCLKTALKGSNGSEFEIIVAANGCKDRTVEIARTTAPHATIIDLPVGSKTAAINAANDAAHFFPRIYLDADIECEFRSLLAMAQAMSKPDIRVVAPAIRLETLHCNWLVKAYYAAWMKQPFAKKGKGGAGCYGISEHALTEIGQFPEIVGDDIWIHTRFPDEMKAMIREDQSGQPVYSIVRPPRTIWQQIKVEARRINGNAEVKQSHPSPYFALANADGGISGALKSNAGPINLLVFFAVKAAVKMKARIDRARGHGNHWTRDQSSR